MKTYLVTGGAGFIGSNFVLYMLEKYKDITIVNVDKLTYHLENCKLLEGKETNEVSWEYIKMVGFWQCPECNPPRYEDYANAQ